MCPTMHVVPRLLSPLRSAPVDVDAVDIVAKHRGAQDVTSGVRHVGAPIDDETLDPCAQRLNLRRRECRAELLELPSAFAQTRGERVCATDSPCIRLAQGRNQDCALECNMPV